MGKSLIFTSQLRKKMMIKIERDRHTCKYKIHQKDIEDFHGPATKGSKNFNDSSHAMRVLLTKCTRSE